MNSGNLSNYVCLPRLLLPNMVLHYDRLIFSCGVHILIPSLRSSFAGTRNVPLNIITSDNCSIISNFVGYPFTDCPSTRNNFRMNIGVPCPVEKYLSFWSFGRVWPNLLDVRPDHEPYLHWSLRVCDLTDGLDIPFGLIARHVQLGPCVHLEGLPADIVPKKATRLMLKS